MKEIIFYDLLHKGRSDPFYSDRSLELTALPGAIRSLILVAEELVKEYNVYILQMNRPRVSVSRNGVIYAPHTMTIEPEKVAAVVYLWSNYSVEKIFPLFPNAKQIVWFDDNLYSTPLYSNIPFLNSVGATILGNSKYHRAFLERTFEEFRLPTSKLHFEYIYNPVPDDLVPNETKYDRNKLFFASSPRKGLDQALEILVHLRKADPRFYLAVANSSIHHPIPEGREGVLILGPIAHPKVIQQMRHSLCLFYPNYVYPETFGLVLAEANSVGTPVLTHNLGAASEILRDDSQIIDATDREALVDRVLSWQKGARPKVEGHSFYRTSNVLEKWQALIEE